MCALSQPFVSVVTPVYNGEKYLAQCIESVLGQTYENWEYVIVNNCSTDRSLEIAQKYSRMDARIRIHNNNVFLRSIENHNHALRQMSHMSTYCKVVHADDWLFPDCLENMVTAASMNPSVGLVGCYTVTNAGIRWGGLPYPSTFMAGREICRSVLLGGPYVFGPPTTFLVRSELIRNRETFYDERHVYADTEACYDVLQSSNFSFVHQVLTFVRVHDESLSSSLPARYNSYVSARLYCLMTYGPIYLTKAEQEARLMHVLSEYYKFLGKSVFHFKEREFWRFHQRELEDAGCPLRIGRLMRSAAREVCCAILHPLNSIRKIRLRLSNV